MCCVWHPSVDLFAQSGHTHTHTDTSKPSHRHQDMNIATDIARSIALESDDLSMMLSFTLPSWIPASNHRPFKAECSQDESSVIL